MAMHSLRKARLIAATGKMGSTCFFCWCKREKDVPNEVLTALPARDYVFTPPRNVCQLSDAGTVSGTELDVYWVACILHPMSPRLRATQASPLQDA